MEYVYPDYYRQFTCIGGECPDTCCAGWEIDIDEDSYAYYNSVEGPFSKRLKEMYPDAQILPLDYDPDVSFANIENRLQMLIMNAKSGNIKDKN